MSKVTLVGFKDVRVNVPDAEPVEPPITELHKDFIMDLLMTREVSPILARATEIIMTTRSSARVAEELIVVLVGLRLKGAPRFDPRAHRQSNVRFH
jgi:hypothetical protein